MDEGVKITGISLTPLPDGAGRILLSVETSEGIQGLSVCAIPVGGQVEKVAQQMLIGEDARAVTAHYKRTQDAGASLAAAAALDIALWDAKAKGEEVPLWRCLGGDALPANLLSNDHDGHGARIALSDDAAIDLHRIGQAHKALSKRLVEPVLVVTVPMGWRADNAIARMKEIERHFDISYIEAPCAADDVDGHAKVSAAIRAGVCNGRGFGHRSDFASHLAARSLDIFMLDIHAIGITGAIEMADAAFTYELPVLFAASAGNIAVHLAGAMPYFAFAEYHPPIASLESAVLCKDGKALAGFIPGNGLAVAS